MNNNKIIVCWLKYIVPTNYASKTAKLNELSCLSLQKLDELAATNIHYSYFPTP